MKNFIHYIFTAICLAFGALLMSCEEVIPEHTHNLNEGYWLSDNEELPLFKFDGEGELFQYIYKESDDHYYAYFDSNANRKYLLDVENSTLYVHPDNKWYDIYVLTYHIFVIGNNEGEELKFHKIPAKSVDRMPKSDFEEMFPADSNERSSYVI